MPDVGPVTSAVGMCSGNHAPHSGWIVADVSGPPAVGWTSTCAAQWLLRDLSEEDPEPPAIELEEFGVVVDGALGLVTFGDVDKGASKQGGSTS